LRKFKLSGRLDQLVNELFPDVVPLVEQFETMIVKNTL